MYSTGHPGPRVGRDWRAHQGQGNSLFHTLAWVAPGVLTPGGRVGRGLSHPLCRGGPGRELFTPPVSWCFSHPLCRGPGRGLLTPPVSWWSRDRAFHTPCVVVVQGGGCTRKGVGPQGPQELRPRPRSKKQSSREPGTSFSEHLFPTREGDTHFRPCAAAAAAAVGDSYASCASHACARCACMHCAYTHTQDPKPALACTLRLCTPESRTPAEGRERQQVCGARPRLLHREPLGPRIQQHAAPSPPPAAHTHASPLSAPAAGRHRLQAVRGAGGRAITPVSAPADAHGWWWGTG